ncbi:uncharacterized protein LACBIDRAFT_302120 [Laccaria bicolor S238N-H82]|uniref:Predicted protein n=1 Tax=Laccaria bicolor (strain S238N-H82 / ATCC MYA-4686) TaxID=486041 RepID=B0DH40_LACBS|nr:uncharacterized protein LACBIDRAFT_302120 [Laccaria bicolor S238N-H82]EDR06045.1 predicted protein [Laccaria bicolor S238N-H82]|eukprot:XP_001883333.1 predicted protein [Laccaria bicolor S238N-H82]
MRLAYHLSCPAKTHQQENVAQSNKRLKFITGQAKGVSDHQLTVLATSSRTPESLNLA